MNTKTLLNYNNFYLVGIKGVAMTSMAQLLVDANKKVSGADVEEEFVTQAILNKLNLKIDFGFNHQIPEGVDCVIFTAAHNGQFNPLVIKAQEKDIPTYSHATAQADLFNQKKGIAVCGVGGKSTVSAMISWIFEKNNLKSSFAVGVGNIPGLEKTAQWNEDSEYFIAEADEYVTDPSAPKRDEEITPRFSFLKPFTTVCTNLKYDHPDVYKDFDHTKEMFFKFFNQIDSSGYLVINYEDLVHNPTTSAKNIVTFGKNTLADFSYIFEPSQQKPGVTIATILNSKNSKLSKNNTYHLALKVPGEYNVQNALAAIVACSTANISIEQSVLALKSFNSTQRRFESCGTKNGVVYYDDYAHHPNEIKSAISALNNWYKDQKKIVVFQPHTYSRTKQLLHEFIHSFKSADEVYFLDIFASAREDKDLTVSTDDIVKGIQKIYPEIKVKNLHTINELAKFLTSINPNSNDESDTVVLTLGAGDIYKVHDKI
jgi:UDP-N-acetylmuramate--alanine ligase